MATRSDNKWPTWVIVVALIILIPILIWALSLVMHIAWAMSIGGILFVVGVVVLFIWIKGRVDEQR